MTETAPHDPPAAAVPDDLPRAPDSERIKQWNRRIAGWGCAPLMVFGLLAGFVPALAERMTLVGTALALLIGVPLVVHAWRLRRENQARYEAAHAEAAASGRRVRVVKGADGDNEYHLVEIEPIEPLSWQAGDGGAGTDGA
jgi:hypothetical protein